MKKRNSSHHGMKFCSTKFIALFLLVFCFGSIVLLQARYNRIKPLTSTDSSSYSPSLPQKSKIAFLFIARNRMCNDRRYRHTRHRIHVSKHPRHHYNGESPLLRGTISVHPDELRHVTECLWNWSGIHSSKVTKRENFQFMSTPGQVSFLMKSPHSPPSSMDTRLMTVSRPLFFHRLTGAGQA